MFLLFDSGWVWKKVFSVEILIIFEYKYQTYFWGMLQDFPSEVYTVPSEAYQVPDGRR